MPSALSEGSCKFSVGDLRGGVTCGVGRGGVALKSEPGEILRKGAHFNMACRRLARNGRRPLPKTAGGLGGAVSPPEGPGQRPNAHS